MSDWRLSPVTCYLFASLPVTWGIRPTFGRGNGEFPGVQAGISHHPSGAIYVAISVAEKWRPRENGKEKRGVFGCQMAALTQFPLSPSCV